MDTTEKRTRHFLTCRKSQNTCQMNPDSFCQHCIDRVSRKLFATAERQQLEAALRELRTALEHYADVENWEKNDDVDSIYARVWKIKHGFHFAREALAKAKALLAEKKT